jgi:hypothetical protein
MSNEPYKVPEGHTVHVDVETKGGGRQTTVTIKRPDGSTEQTFVHLSPQPSWMEDCLVGQNERLTKKVGRLIDVLRR